MKLNQIRVLVCDDHELIREGLKRILVDTGVAASVGEASNATEVLRAVEHKTWDIVILDLNLGGIGGLQVLKEIKASFPRLPVIMLSVYPEEEFAVRSIRAGASAYLAKNHAAKVVLQAIREVLTTGIYVSSKVAGQLVHAVKQGENQPLHATLSDREDQVFRLIASGRTVGQIAEQLKLSVKTVSTYRAIVLRKLNLENNAQLMRYAQDHALSSIDS